MNVNFAMKHINRALNQCHCFTNNLSALTMSDNHSKCKRAANEEGWNAQQCFNEPECKKGKLYLEFPEKLI